MIVGAEAAGEQGEHYDPLFPYGTEAGSFAHPEESGGDAADIGPSGAGTSKGSPVASSFVGWSTGDSASGPVIRADSAKIFRWSPWRLMRLLRCLRRRHLMVLS